MLPRAFLDSLTQLISSLPCEGPQNYLLRVISLTPYPLYTTISGSSFIAFAILRSSFKKSSLRRLLFFPNLCIFFCRDVVDMTVPPKPPTSVRSRLLPALVGRFFPPPYTFFPMLPPSPCSYISASSGRLSLGQIDLVWFFFSNGHSENDFLFRWPFPPVPLLCIPFCPPHDCCIWTEL